MPKFTKFDNLVYIITLKLNPGGTENHLLRVLRELNKDNFNIRVISIYGRGALDENFIESGIYLWRPKCKLHAFCALKSFFYIIFLMLRDRNAIFHFWLPYAYILGGFCGVLTRARVMMMSRRSLNHYQKKYFLVRFLEKMLHKKMKFVLSNSRAVANDLLEEGVPSAKLRIIPNCVDISEYSLKNSYSSVRVELNIPDKCFVICCVANLIEYKGHDTLIDALGKISTYIPDDWRLICAGADHGIKHSLIQRAKQLNIADKILFLGSRTDVPDIFRASDISVLASHEEGSSNAVIEAMALGCPVIATAVGGNRELISDGETGLLVPPKNIDALASAILKLTRDPILRNKVGLEALNYIQKNHSLSACISEYKSIYLDAYNHYLS